VVESVGEGVRRVKPSDRVAFTGVPGAYSEAVVADAERLIPLPDEFTFEQGAAFPLQGMTAQSTELSAHARGVDAASE